MGYTNGVYVPGHAETGYDTAKLNDTLTRISEQWINIKAEPYGADSTGVADCSGPISAALADLGSDGGTLFFPPGYYKLTSTVVLDNYQYVRFVGTGNMIGIQNPLSPGVIIDSQSVTGPAFSYDGSVDALTAVHYWENIVIMAGRTGWKYKDAARGVFENCGVRCRVNDGNADNTGVLFINSFWFDFIGGTYEAPSVTDPAMILRGQSGGLATTASYLVTCDRVLFVFGAAQCEWNAGGLPSNVAMTGCSMESSTGMPFVKYVQSGSHSTDYTTCILTRCVHFDQGASAPLIEVNAADLVLQRPVLNHCQQGVGNPGILVTAGSVLMPRITGAPTTMYGSFVMDGSNNLLAQVRDRDHGTDFIDTSSDQTQTALTNRDGTMFRFARSGDAYARHGVDTAGIYYWGPGGATSTGWDIQLSRTAANTLTLASGDSLRTTGSSHSGLPAASGFASGSMYYCITDKQPLWSDGTNWVEADGTNH